MVMTMRRVLSALAVLGLFLTTLAVGHGASAAPYPPTTSAALSVSSTTPCEGQTIKVGGANFGATEVVLLAIGGNSAGSATTDSSGSFDPTVTTPNLVGGQTLTGDGQTSGRSSSLTLTIRDCSSAGGAGGTTGGGGNLASTGVKIAGLSLLAAALLGGGMFFVTAGRRRKSAAAA